MAEWLAQDYAERSETLIFYEAPHRIVASLKDMAEVFGESRPATLCRELTKTFETVRKSTLGELVDFVASDSNQQKADRLGGGRQYNDVNDDLSVHDTLLLRLPEDLSVKQLLWPLILLGLRKMLYIKDCLNYSKTSPR